MNDRLTFNLLKSLLFILLSVSTSFAEPGNTDGEDGINLRDSILALQICSGMSSQEINLNGDANRDNRIGLAEAIYALQVTSGLRTPILFVSDNDKPVQINLSLIDPDSSNSSLKAVLPSDNIADMDKLQIDIRDDTDYTWTGTIESDESGNAVMTVIDGVIFGNISTEGKSYSVQPDADGYKISENKPEYIAPHGDDGVMPDSYLTKRFKRYSQREGGGEDGSRIDILVLYTLQMQTKYGNNLKSLIQHFTDLSNQAYRNSGVNTQLKLVHSQLYDNPATTEGNDSRNALDHITKNSDAISNLRDTYKADLVNLLRVHPGSNVPCGRAWVMGSDWLGLAFESAAFSVVEVRPVNEANPYYCSELTFAHEIGHNMGCAHDRDHAGVDGAYDYSYGYDIPGTFATVMSYDYPEIIYFSTPEVFYQDSPIGKSIDNSDSAYNALTINNTTSVVANFRQNAINTCFYNLNPTNAVFNPPGGNGNLNILTKNGCYWTAVSNAEWLNIVSGNSGIGNGVVKYTVDNYSRAPGSRIGIIVIAGKEFAVRQCMYRISGQLPYLGWMSPDGWKAEIGVTTDSDECAWNVTTDSDWINISSGDTYTGANLVTFITSLVK